MAQVAHTAAGFSLQELDRIEATLATMQTWLEMWKAGGAFTWDTVELLHSIANRLEDVEGHWNTGGRND
jgi:hypothetical protein